MTTLESDIESFEERLNQMILDICTLQNEPRFKHMQCQEELAQADNHLREAFYLFRKEITEGEVF